MEKSAKSKPVIGLLGGIGSGKSTVARAFASLGCGVIDADELGKMVLKQKFVLQHLQEWWGPGVIGPDGLLNRAVVSQIVFKDKTQLSRLENLVHPRVDEARLAFHEKYQKDPNIKAIVEDSPLLLEKGMEFRCDVLVFVDAKLATRLTRVKANRGWSADELAKREKHQIGLDIKAKRADYVVDNNGGEAECLSSVRHVLSQILQERN